MKKKIIRSIMKIASVGAFAALLLVMAASVRAQCGGAFDALAASAMSIQSKSKPDMASMTAAKTQTFTILSGDDGDSSIVGLWHVKFNIMEPGVPDPITIQEAFQIWNTGGTEVHNPKIDPRTGPVCLGAWREDRGMYKLAHRVWSYSSDGVFLGTINLAESVRVTNRGRSQTGTFALDFFDPDGNPLEVPGVHPSHVEGVVVGQRIAPN